MRHLLNQLSLMLSAVFLVSCASAIPPARIGDYVSSGHQPGERGLHEDRSATTTGRACRGVRYGSARCGSKSAGRGARSPRRKPTTGPWSCDSCAITELISADRIRPQPHGDWVQFAELGRQRGLEYLAVVVVSSTEQEYPMTFFLGLTTHAQPGFRRDNWSLLEFALLDLKHNQILMQAEGRGWATLDRPSAPGINQWYPAIYLRPQDQRRIWPPTYEGAPNTLRVVSFEQAAKRLVLKLQNSWLGVLESEATARKASS